MADIILSADHIRNAPIEVRRWIETELADSLGIRSSAPVSPPAHHEQLVACRAEEIEQVFNFVEGMQPVVNVLLELGRTAGARLPNNIIMKTLHEIAERAHLRSAQQVVACLRIVNDALQQLRNDSDALLCAVDEEERCYVTLETQTQIQKVWQAIIEAHTQAFAAKPVQTSCAPPYAVAAASEQALETAKAS